MPNYAIVTLENVSVSFALAAAGSSTRTLPWGTPGDALYIGKWPNRVRLAQRLEEFIYQPSGVRFPKRLQTNGNFKITIEGVHVFQDGAASFDPLRTALGFMEVIAFSEDLSAWKRWYFYGVTCSEADFFDAEVEMNESRSFDAWFARNDVGGIIPPEPNIIEFVNDINPVFG